MDEYISFLNDLDQLDYKILKLNQPLLNITHEDGLWRFKVFIVCTDGLIFNEVIKDPSFYIAIDNLNNYLQTTLHRHIS